MSYGPHSPGYVCHATGTEEALEAIATPTTLDEVGAAQIAAYKVWETRGAYGAEWHLYQQTMRRVSAPLTTLEASR